MKKYLIPIILFWCCKGWTQTVYLCGASNQINELDINSCQARLLVQLTLNDTINDLAIGPSHELYGISDKGNLYLIDPELRTTIMVHTFLFLQSFHALICDSQGILYTTGSEGFLYSYDRVIDKDRFLGDVGFTTVGDLLFRSNILYATTIDQKIIQVNEQTPSASELIGNSDPFGLITGLFAFDGNTIACEIPATFGVTNGGKILTIDLETGSVKELCDLNLSATGAASIFDLSDLVPLTITDLQVNKSKCNVATGSVSISALGGTGQLNYVLEDSSQTDSIFKNMEAGIYRIKVVDENNCTVTEEAIIERTTPPSITDMIVSNARCPEAHGSVTIVANGMTSLAYSVDQENFQNTEHYEQISAGHYLATAIDTNGCFAEKEFEIISEDLLMIKTIAVSPSSCEAINGGLTITMKSALSDLTYTLDDVTQEDAVFTDLGAGKYQLMIVDNMGCRIDTVVQISDTPCSLYVPNSFSPNHDLVNDDFRIFTSSQAGAQVMSYQIFDRWGDHIYSAANFPIHSDHHWWDGTLHGRQLGNGIYVYVIEISYDDGSREILKGQVSLVG